MQIKDKITEDGDPMRLKSFLIVSTAAFVVYPTLMVVLGSIYFQYDNQWWFERIDWNQDAIGVFFQLLSPWMALVMIPCIVGIYGGYHFLVLRRRILDRTLKAMPRKITIGVVLLWTPWIALFGIFMLHPIMMSIWSEPYSVLRAIQNFIFVPVLSLITVNLPGMLSLYVYRLRKEYGQKH